MDPAIRRHTLGDLLRRTARRSPDRLAVAHDDVRWSYADFDAVCNRLAHGLAGLGIREGDRVAILSRNSHMFAAVRFAVARLGAVLVPINFALTADEVAYILRHSGANTLCAAGDLAETAEPAVRADTAVQRVVALPPAAAGPSSAWIPIETVLSEEADEPRVEIATQDLAQIIYTSGTESRPKGAMLTHEAVLWQYVSCVVDGEMQASDVMLHAMPLYHCAQLDVCLGPAVYVGASNIIVAQPKPEVILPRIERHGITSFFAPPTVWIALLRSPQFDACDLSSLTKGYYGAAIMPVEILQELGRRLPQTRFWNLYGQTEIAPLATLLGPDDQMPRAGSAGRPVLNVETRVVDEAGQPIAPGEIGEIVHRSPQLLSGYYQSPEQTAEAFAGGWFHSGDLATVDAEGYITVVDRKKDMIKTGGENVASREVEETIYALPGVSEVAVIGVPHPYWIEAVVAVIVPRSDHDLTPEKVMGHCQAGLAGFKVPKQVVFAEALPKNPSGKVLKRELRERYHGVMDGSERLGP